MVRHIVPKGRGTQMEIIVLRGGSMRAFLALAALVLVIFTSILVVGSEMEDELPDELPAVVREEMKKSRERAPAPRDADGRVKGIGGGGGHTGEPDANGRGTWSEVVSWSPRLLHIHNVLWPEEIEHLIAIGKSQMERSTVVGAKGESVVDHVRTSKGTFLQRLQDPIIKRIEQRISRVRTLSAFRQRCRHAGCGGHTVSHRIQDVWFFALYP